MNTSTIINLSDKAVRALKKIAPYKKYTSHSPLHYQGQTPIVAYYIIKGSILLQKKNKTYHKMTTGSLIGYRELLLNIPSLFTAQAQKNTELCYIDKSTFYEIMNSSNAEMQRLYHELSKIIGTIE